MTQEEAETARRIGSFQKQLAEVLVAWPLYRKLSVKGDFRSRKENHHPASYYLALPFSVTMRCAHCGHFQPWDIQMPFRGIADSSFELVAYRCRACTKNMQHYALLLHWDDQASTVTKIGQFPPLEREPPELVAAMMNREDLALYRKALTCRNSNFGIAAVAYLRRIVENMTNGLIDLIAERAKEEDPLSALLTKVDEIKADKRFSEKIDFASALLPVSVRTSGRNPVAMLHALTSEALHGLSDEESIEVFDECQLAFEHVVRRLKLDREEDEEFKLGMQLLEQRMSGRKKQT